MKAILCIRPGGPDDLIYTDLPEPQAGPGEAVVDVKAAALNFFDTLIIANKYQIKPAFPFSPSAEFAGVVRSVGSGVRGLAPGDSVLGYLGHGCARERLAAPAERLAPLPPGFDFDRAAGLSIVYGTTYHALKDRARLRPGETLAVLGAAGGVGLAAVEIGKLMGARVIACASSDDKCAFARRHGADETINYGTTDLKTALKAATGGRGADVVYDPVGGDFTETAVRATAWNGRFLVIGFAAGTIPKLPLNLVLLKGIDLCGVYWGAFAEREPAAQRANMAQIVAWCTQGKLSSHVHEVYPLAQTAQALKDIAARKIMGKAILHP